MKARIRIAAFLVVGMGVLAAVASGLTGLRTASLPLAAATPDSGWPLYLPWIGKAYSAPTSTPTPLHTPTPTSTPTGAVTPAATPTPTQTATPEATGTPSVTPTPTPSATVTPGARSATGVQMFGEINDEVARTRAREAGIEWVRLYLEWSAAEPSPPVNGEHAYNWESYDHTFANAGAANLVPLVTIQGNPSWAATTRCGPIDLVPLTEFASFLGALVERYDGDGVHDMPGLQVPIKYWELINEPDFDQVEGAPGGCWGADVNDNGIADAQEYAQMLTYAYPAIKASDPEAQVVFGSIAFDLFSADSRPPDYPFSAYHFSYDFLEGVLGAIVENPNAAQNNYFFDVMNFHQYDAFRDYWDGPQLPYDQGIIGKARAVRETLARHGLTKPMMTSEVGLQVGPSSEVPSAELLEQQAQHLVHVFVRGMAAGLRVMVWYTIVDKDPLRYGLFDSNDANYQNPRPAYHAWRVLTTELTAASFESQLGPAETGSQNIQAYRFHMPDGRKKLILWIDTGQRIKSQPSSAEDVEISAVHLSPWTGRLRVVSLHGAETIIEDGGTSDRDEMVNDAIRLQISQSPVYVESSP